MEGKESVQRGIGNDIITPNQQGQIFAKYRDGAKQGDNHLRPPKGHLTPWQ